MSHAISDDLLKRFDVPGPRYTSYPTADRFVEAFTEADYIQALEQRRAGSMALRGQEAGGEQKAVAGEEEADQQAGLGEHDREQAEVADRSQQHLEVESEHGASFCRGR